MRNDSDTKEKDDNPLFGEYYGEERKAAWYLDWDPNEHSPQND